MRREHGRRTVPYKGSCATLPVERLAEMKVEGLRIDQWFRESWLRHDLLRTQNEGAEHTKGGGRSRAAGGRRSGALAGGGRGAHSRVHPRHGWLDAHRFAARWEIAARWETNQIAHR